MERIVLHSDCNNFYATAECSRRPEISNFPVVVTGDVEARHGIVLAKNMIAKKAGIQTGDVIWKAKKKCPQLVSVPADFPYYLYLSQQVRKIYDTYTDRVEAFGIDECWLDVSESRRLFGDGKTIAEEIREKVKDLGLTVSIGISYNKIFAKLASEMKKPDAVTQITKQNFQSVVWPLPVEELLYVGKATKRKLNAFNIWTIGDLARAPENFLTERLGIWGSYLKKFALGEDDTPVQKTGEEPPIKSIGNSITNYRDLNNRKECEALLYQLADSVASRLRESGLGGARVVHLSVKNNQLESLGAQKKLPRPLKSAKSIAVCAIQLLEEIYRFDLPVRALGVSVSDFTNGVFQMELGENEEDKIAALEETVESVRKKFGYKSIARANALEDKRQSSKDIKNEHVIHPENFFKK